MTTSPQPRHRRPGESAAAGTAEYPATLPMPAVRVEGDAVPSSRLSPAEARIFTAVCGLLAVLFTAVCLTQLHHLLGWAGPAWAVTIVAAVVAVWWVSAEARMGEGR